MSGLHGFVIVKNSVFVCIVFPLHFVKVLLQNNITVFCFVCFFVCHNHEYATTNSVQPIKIYALRSRPSIFSPQFASPPMYCIAGCFQRPWMGAFVVGCPSFACRPHLKQSVVLDMLSHLMDILAPALRPVSTCSCSIAV